jgi:hypothetical protein
MRSFLFFNTSTIPSNADIISAKLSIYGYKDLSETNFNIIIQKGSSGHPNTPLTLSDYDKDYYSGEGGSLNTQNFNENQYNHITLNSDGRSWIQQGTGAKTKFCLRSSRDKNCVDPYPGSGYGWFREYVLIYTNEKGGDYRPKLTVEYNLPPNTPSNPNPSNHATGVSINKDLSWTCSDPDGDSLTYDVYFGTSSNPPKVSSGQSSKSYDPGTMNPSTKYYWKIKAIDEHGATKTGPIWDFTTESQYTINFYTDPANKGTITFDGTTYNHGQNTQKIAGTYNIKANPGSDKIFSHWSKTGSISIANPNQQQTTADVSGTGSIKAHFVDPQPILSYDPNSLDFGNRYQGCEDSEKFEIWNSGTGELTYTISENINWLSVSPTSGSSSGEHDEITVTIENTGSMNGDYSGTIFISSNGGSGSISVEISIKPPAKWTVIAYLCGDNDLESWCSDCLNYMDNVGSEYGNLEIIALLDGDAASDTHAYHVLKNDKDEISLNKINSNWNNEVNMGDPNTLIDFSKYCIKNFPANQYMIIPQDHGSTWIGCCQDFNSNGDILDIDDLKVAFQAIKNYIGKKIEIVFFNDCLMNSIEITYQIKPYVEWQVGSETVSYQTVCDNEYENILELIRSTPGINCWLVAYHITSKQTIVDDSEYRTQFISTIDLCKIESIKTSINNLADIMINEINNGGSYFEEIESSRNHCEYIRGPYDSDIEEIIDIKDFVEKIKTYSTHTEIKTKAQDVIDSINDAIENEKHTDSANFCNGISIYFPDRVHRYKSDYTTGNMFSADTKWDEFLDEYLEKMETIHGQSGGGKSQFDAYIKAKVGNEESFYVFGEDIDATDNFDPGMDVNYTDSPRIIEVYSDYGYPTNNCFSVELMELINEHRLWTMIVEWQGTDTVNVDLSWDISSIKDSAYSGIFLLDTSNDKKINLKNSDSYSFSIGPQYKKIFRIILTNHPTTPEITGPISGIPDNSYKYSFKSYSVGDKKIEYHIDWGDSETTHTGLCPSGESEDRWHSWNRIGNYKVKAYATDEDGLSSDTGTLSVTIPRGKLPFNSIILRILDRFPRAFPILKYILNQQ